MDVKCFWKITNSRTTGKASTTPPASSEPSGLSARPAMFVM